MAVVYISTTRGSPYNPGNTEATPVASPLTDTAVVTGYIGNSSDGGTTISSPSSVLTVTGITSGFVSGGRRVSGTGVTAGTFVTNEGSTLGLAGQYTVNTPQSVPITTFTINNPNMFGGPNVYFIERDSVIDATNISGGLTIPASSTWGSYGVGADPKIVSSSGVALSVANRTGLVMSDLTIVSTAQNALNAFNHGSSSWNNCSFTGDRSGFNLAVTTAKQDLIFNFCKFKNTVGTGVKSGFFSNTSVNGAIFKNLQFNSCTFDGCQGIGLQLKTGDAGTTNSYFDGVLIKSCTFRYNGSAGIIIGVADVAAGGDVNRTLRNLVITGCDLSGNLGPGMGVVSNGGKVSDTKVYNNNYGTVTGTGGLQLGGCTNMTVEHCYVVNNGSGGYGADGIGIYLDQVVGNSFYGTNQCVIRWNYIQGHTDFTQSDNTAGNQSSAGIKIYRSNYNEVYGNILVGNNIGINIGSSSNNNKVYNNTIIDSVQIGIANSWNIGPTNQVMNNIIVGSQVDLLSTTVGDYTSAGSLTLTNAGTASPIGQAGTATATSSSADFAAHHSGYIIRETSGPGFGYIYAPKVNDSTVLVSITVPFSSTTYAAGAWKLSYGTSQVGCNDGNMCFNKSRANGGVGAAQVLTNLSAGANDIPAVDPRLDIGYRTAVASLVAGGLKVGAMLDYYGKEFLSPPTVGAVQAQPSRTAFASSAITPYRNIVNTQ